MLQVLFPLIFPTVKSYLKYNGFVVNNQEIFWYFVWREKILTRRKHEVSRRFNWKNGFFRYFLRNFVSFALRFSTIIKSENFSGFLPHVPLISFFNKLLYPCFNLVSNCSNFWKFNIIWFAFERRWVSKTPM